ncbi:MAG: glycosyltransferase family 8 protein [Lachnospiraceae bacterium]|nr:glycosyltransferase family 8 protein [Lachnospiraceae bacterium]
MNILVSVNDAYVHPLAVMLTSLLHNNRDRKIVIYLLYSNISNLNIKKLNRLIKHFNAELIPIKINNGFLDRIPINDFAKETYYRLFAFKFLPKTLKKILFLDPDMVVTGNIAELYDTDLPKDCCFCAVEDMSKDIENSKKRLRIPENCSYYNSGTLLMNLDTIRNVFDEDKIIEYAVKNRFTLYYCDQDLLNVFFGNNIQRLESCYNFEARFHNLYDIFGYIIENLKLRHEFPKIIHYMGYQKPWKKGYGGKYQLLFNRYAAMAGVKDMLEYSVYNKIFFGINYLNYFFGK